MAAHNGVTHEQWQAKRIAQRPHLLRPVPMRTIRTVTMPAGARLESEWVMALVTASLSQGSTLSNTGTGRRETAGSAGANSSRSRASRPSRATRAAGDPW
jgi:hypothetical protein